MNKNSKKPNFLFRAVIIFVVAALVIINIMLTYSTNSLTEELNVLKEELKKETLEREALEQRLNAEMTDENIRKEATEMGYGNGDDIKFIADIPNS